MLCLSNLRTCLGAWPTGTSADPIHTDKAKLLQDVGWAPPLKASDPFYGSWTGACGPSWSCREAIRRMSPFGFFLELWDWLHTGTFPEELGHGFISIF